MRLETPIVRVFRGETWLTVYRSVAVVIFQEKRENQRKASVSLIIHSELEKGLF